MALTAENELRQYQLIDYIRKHGFNCYTSNDNLFMEVPYTTPSGAKCVKSVKVDSFDQVNSLMIY